MRHGYTIIFLGIVFAAILGLVFFSLDDTPSPVSETKEEYATSSVFVILGGLEVPWDFAFLPDGGLLITERAGNVIHRTPDGKETNFPLVHTAAGGEGGLLGITLDPEFRKNRFVYIYVTYAGTDGNEKNRVERYEFHGSILANRVVIIDDIDGAPYHDGGRIEFGPDGFLYITTGDAGNPKSAQDTRSLSGKILRIRKDSTIPDDNPFGNAVYSYGHRNPQGITWDEDGNLWSTEHGRSGILSGYDELNLIRRGKNYGWPLVQGEDRRSGMETPVIHSGPNVTWAPASAAYLEGSIFFGGLRGETLYEAVLGERERIGELKTHFVKEFGRLRTVRVGPDGMLYVTTSNLDGRGETREGDDKLIRINPRFLQ